jgi:hypothetical protein
LFRHGAAVNLLRQQPTDTSEDATGARFLQECANVAREDLADRLADYFQREAIAGETGDKLRPLLGSTDCSARSDLPRYGGALEAPLYRAV